MKMQEIRPLLMGKTISYYDGWGGLSNYFKIGYMLKDGNSVRVFPEKGRGWGVFIPIAAIPQLVETGKYQTNGEVERCSFSTTWELLQ